jgi:hypothetical protein
VHRSSLRRQARPAPYPSPSAALAVATVTASVTGETGSARQPARRCTIAYRNWPRSRSIAIVQLRAERASAGAGRARVRSVGGVPNHRLRRGRPSSAPTTVTPSTGGWIDDGSRWAPTRKPPHADGWA